MKVIFFLHFLWLLNRIEEIPKEEMEIAEDEALIPVAHFYKDVFSTFGVPFLIKVKHVSTEVTSVPQTKEPSWKIGWTSLLSPEFCGLAPLHFSPQLLLRGLLHRWHRTLHTLPRSSLVAYVLINVKLIVFQVLKKYSSLKYPD